jgi:hypothetical protein
LASSTIKGYSEILLETIQDSSDSKLAPSKVTLEFGIQVGGETGIPFVTKGTTQANVKVTVEWIFTKKT